MSYPNANDETRKLVVEKIIDYIEPANEPSISEEASARTHFDFLSWLVRIMPDCPYANAALSPIITKHPTWEISDHPDFLSWHESLNMNTNNSWTVEQLLSTNPSEKLSELLSYKAGFYSDRFELMSTIENACMKNINWAARLIMALSDRVMWDSDFWPSIISGVQKAELSENEYLSFLTSFSKHELYKNNSYYIANFLYELVKDRGKSYALKLLIHANKVSLEIWKLSEVVEDDNVITDWLSAAINSTEGRIVLFWLNGLSLLLKTKPKSEKRIPDDYLPLFDLVINDKTLKGGKGRCILASQLPFLYRIDESWTRKNIIPLFTQTNSEAFRQAWHGFLAWGNLTNTSLAEEMLPSFISAARRLNELSKQRDRFIGFYTYLAIYIVDNPNDEFIPILFNNGDLTDRLQFASHLGYMLKSMKTETKQRLWSNWLKKYWEQRLNGIPIPLEADENVAMLSWLPFLDDAFCDAVKLVTRTPIKQINSIPMLYNITKSELLTQFPKECAELVIYLCKYIAIYPKTVLLEIARKLIDIPPELDKRLRESLATIGLKI